MATTQMTSSNALSVELWAERGFVDAFKRKSIGTALEQGAIFQAEELLRANAGDSLTFSFTGILTGIGTGEGGQLEGNEEALNLSSDTMTVNILRHGVNNPCDFSIEQQRTTVDFEQDSRTLLPEWLGSRMDAGFLQQAAGAYPSTITVDSSAYTGSDRLYVTGHNTPTAPTTNRHTFAGSATNDQSLTSSDTMNLALVDEAIEDIQATYPYMAPLTEDGMYIMLISPQQLTQLKQDTSTAITWYTNYTSAMQGGDIENNPIFKANGISDKPVGEYSNVKIYVSTRIPQGVNSSNSSTVSDVRRAVILGRDAVAFGTPMGRFSEGNPPMKFTAQYNDHDYYKAIGIASIFGFKKPVFDGEDLAAHVISTYATN